jgi:hypothetical protein
VDLREMDSGVSNPRRHTCVALWPNAIEPFLVGLPKKGHQSEGRSAGRTAPAELLRSDHSTT